PLPLLFWGDADHRDLHSFPTRRSSDLPNIAFDGSLSADLLGAPVDLQWLNGELYVLFLRDKQLHLAHFKDFGEQLEYRVQAVERSEEHTSELQSREKLVCRLLLAKKKD